MRIFVMFVIFFALVTTLVIGSLSMHVRTLPDDSTAEHLTDFEYISAQGDKKTLSLPATIQLPNYTGFTLEKHIVPGQYHSIMVKTAFTEVRVFADEELIYSAGFPGTYPDWMLDPPTILKIVHVPDTASLLRFEYFSPSQRSSVFLPSIMGGSEAALMMYLFNQNALLMFLSLFMFFSGAILAVTGAVFLRNQAEKAVFIWPGLTLLAFGAWGFAECEASQMIFSYPAALYCIGYAGLFAAVIPLLKFGLVVIRPRHPLLMISAMGVLYVMFMAAFSLQIAGIVALSTSLYAFLVAAPFGIAAFIFTVLWEGIRYKNKIARGFLAPGIVMAVAVFFELLNLRFHFTEVLSLFTLAGLLVFIIFLLILGIRYLRITISNAAEKKRLEDQVKFTNRQLAIQQEQYSGITESVDLARKARHDLRHQLSVIQGYNMANERELQRAYIDELIANIPTAYEKNICENFAVNAVAAYYIAMAESEGIEVDAQMRIPEDTGNVPALDLCVIVGNFVENALDACRRIKDGEKYIRIRSRIDGDTLSIVVTNSYDGVSNEKNGVYLSRKDERYKREGVGLSSVKAICEKHRGLVRIDAGKDSWKSSALIHF